LEFKASLSENGFFDFFENLFFAFLKLDIYKCPILKSDPISFSEFLGVPLIISLKLYKSREPTVPSDTPSLILDYLKLFR